ncbi:hypothetical protein [Faucicola boevrei]|nr:hypothetical protein [Moraxella boevrei]
MKKSTLLKLTLATTLLLLPRRSSCKTDKTSLSNPKPNDKT